MTYEKFNKIEQAKITYNSMKNFYDEYSGYDEKILESIYPDNTNLLDNIANLEPIIHITDVVRKNEKNEIDKVNKLWKDVVKQISADKWDRQDIYDNLDLYVLYVKKDIEDKPDITTFVPDDDNNKENQAKSYYGDEYDFDVPTLDKNNTNDAVTKNFKTLIDYYQDYSDMYNANMNNVILFNSQIITDHQKVSDKMDEVQESVGNLKPDGTEATGVNKSIQDTIDMIADKRKYLMNQIGYLEMIAKSQPIMPPLVQTSTSTQTSPPPPPPPSTQASPHPDSSEDEDGPM